MLGLGLRRAIARHRAAHTDTQHTTILVYMGILIPSLSLQVVTKNILELMEFLVLFLNVY